VAAGVFAPGHLGELTWQVPFELADAVLEETRRRERRLRDLPSRVGIYFVLALGLFPGLGYQNVWAKLTAALDGQGVPCLSAKALRDLRRRVGAAPFKALLEVLAGPVAQPATPGIRFGRYRTVAFDGCCSIKVPGTARNRGWLGKLKAVRGVTGYPAVELMTLCETGTRALIGPCRARATAPHQGMCQDSRAGKLTSQGPKITEPPRICTTTPGNCEPGDTIPRPLTAGRTLTGGTAAAGRRQATVLEPGLPALP